MAEARAVCACCWSPAAAQREFARRADKVIEVNAGHHPFLSQPQAVAGIIASLS